MLPSITLQELERRFHIAKPLVYSKETEQLYVRNIPLEQIGSVAYNWETADPSRDQFLGSLAQNKITIWEQSREEIEKIKARMSEFKEECGTLTNIWDCLTTIPTLHTYGYKGFFKPSVKEVLLQIPQAVFDTYRHVLFYTLPISEDILTVTVGDYHIGRTFLYIPSGNHPIVK